MVNDSSFMEMKKTRSAACDSVLNKLVIQEQSVNFPHSDVESQSNLHVLMQHAGEDYKPLATHTLCDLYLTEATSMLRTLCE